MNPFSHPNAVDVFSSSEYPINVTLGYKWLPYRVQFIGVEQ